MSIAFKLTIVFFVTALFCIIVMTFMRKGYEGDWSWCRTPFDHQVDEAIMLVLLCLYIGFLLLSLGSFCIGVLSL